MSNLSTLSKSFLSEPGVVGTGSTSQWRAKWPAEVTVPSWWTLVFFQGHLSSEQIWAHSDFHLADNWNILGSPGHLWTTLWWQPCSFHQGMPYYVLALHFSFFMPPFLYFLLLASDVHTPVCLFLRTPMLYRLWWACWPTYNPILHRSALGNSLPFILR